MSPRYSNTAEPRKDRADLPDAMYVLDALSRKAPTVGSVWLRAERPIALVSYTTLRNALAEYEELVSRAEAVCLLYEHAPKLCNGCQNVGLEKERRA